MFMIRAFRGWPVRPVFGGGPGPSTVLPVDDGHQTVRFALVISEPIEFTLVFAVAVWGMVLSVQSVHGGVDLSLEFKWVQCDANENLTWVGGLDWDCSAGAH